MRILGIVASSLVKAFQDLFTRTTSGSLGTATSGFSWTALRGTWYANGTAAQSDTAASSYPIASASFGANATTSVDTTGGTGIAFWVTDANNWWASYPAYVQNSSTSSVCNTGYTTGLSSTSSCCGSATSTPGSTTCTGYATGLTSSASCVGSCGSPSSSTSYTCPSGGTLSGTTCVIPSSSEYYGSGGATECIADGGTFDTMSYYCTFPSSSYGATSTTTYACYTSTSTSATTYACYTGYSSTTTYTYNTNVVIVSSVSGTVVTDSTTTLVSASSTLTPVNSMQVITAGDNISVKAYSGAGQSGQIGSTITRTPTTPTKGSSVGIIKAPSTYSQGSTVDTFTATT